MTIAARFDAPLPGSAPEKRTNPLTGALEVRYPLTWTGVRTYRHADGRVTRELRRPEQVFAPSHLRTLRRLVATIGHPQLEDGTPVFLDARGGPGVTDGAGTALRPAEDYQVGHTGDELEREEIDGYPVPVAWCTVTAARAQRLIAGGALQSSLGYLAYLDAHPEPRTWDGPHGPEEYDVEHVLDHEDPRVLEAIARGDVPTVRAIVDGEERDVPVLGGNHHAIAIRAGRGGALSEVRLDATDATGEGPGCCDECKSGHLEACDGAGCVAPGAWSRPAAATRLDAAEVAAAAWLAGGQVRLGLGDGLPADLPGRPLSGTYAVGPEAAGGWLGWIEDADGAAAWIAFVRPDGLGLAWAQRAPSGAVLGVPCLFMRDAACGAPPAPQAPTAEPAAEPAAEPSAAAPAEPLAAEPNATAARADAALYAAPDARDSADLPPLAALPKRTHVKKLTLSAKLEKPAAAVAAALGAGAPARKADSLEIELPENMDPAMLAAALHAMASAMEKMQADKAMLEGQVAELEGAKAEADKMCGSAMAEAERYKADADALRADAEAGRQVRLEQVRGIAKSKVDGLKDEDLKDLDAQGVIKLAVAKRFPKAAGRLDSAPALVESLWEALCDDAQTPPARKPATTPAPRADAADEETQVRLDSDSPKRLTAHNW